MSTRRVIIAALTVIFMTGASGTGVLKVDSNAAATEQNHAPNGHA